MNNKGHIYKGITAGKYYELKSTFLGMGKHFYERSVAGINISSKMRILDMGCGTGSLIFSLAKKVPIDVEFYGCDYSPDQIAYANKKKKQFKHKIVITNSSMDDISYPDNYFDLIVCSMVFHVVKKELHENIIKNSYRMLCNNGKFVLIDMQNQNFLFKKLFNLTNQKENNEKFDLYTLVKLFEKVGFISIHSEKMNWWITRHIFKYNDI